MFVHSIKHQQLQCENGLCRTRYALWRNKGQCNGKYIRDVCVFGVNDIENLLSLKYYFFANKLFIDYQTEAYACLMNRLL